MEIWKEIPAYGRLYEASSFGRIRSKERIVLKRHRSGCVMEQFYRSRILRGSSGRFGHRYVRLGLYGKEFSEAVHRLVLLAFVGNCPDGFEACHADGNPQNNAPDNLRWDTHTANMADRKRHGKYASCDDHPMAKITNEQACFIRSSNLSGVELSKMFGIGQSQVSRIKRGQSRNEQKGKRTP